MVGVETAKSDAINLDKLINELIERVAGEVGVLLYSLQLDGEFTDDQLALELGIEINEIRRALFAMYEVGIAEYRRKRDDETGWMEYYWKINYQKVKEVLKKELEKTKSKLKEKLEAESSNIYYICPNICIKVPYDDAMDLNFTCPKCGSTLIYLDCSKAVEKTLEEIKKIEKLISELS
ncbi:MAG: transcription factor E [Archaeoglobaceae archaeon]